MKQPGIILSLGIAGLIAALAYADGIGFVAVSSIFFVPALVLAAVLYSRVRRKKVEERAAVRCTVAAGAWLLLSSVIGALMVTRPGREGTGMFGSLILAWPLIAGSVASLIVIAFLPAKRLTYIDEVANQPPQPTPLTRRG